MAGEVPEVTMNCSGLTQTLVFLQIVLAQGLPELHQPLGVGVLGLPRGHGPVGRVLDHLGGVVVRLADLQVNDLSPWRSNSLARSRISITRKGVISWARRDGPLSARLSSMVPQDNRRAAGRQAG